MQFVLPVHHFAALNRAVLAMVTRERVNARMVDVAWIGNTVIAVNMLLGRDGYAWKHVKDYREKAQKGNRKDVAD